LIGDVLFKGEMESLNRNCKVVDTGEKESHSRPSIPIQQTFPPRFEQNLFSQFNYVPQTFQYQHTTNQLETGSSITNTPPATLASGSALAEYVIIFSGGND